MKAATMQVIKMILLSNLFFCFQLSAMKEIEEQEQKIENVLIPELSNDISQKILCLKTHEKPWENFDYLIKLKIVCKAWEHAIGTKKNIAKIFNIPPMHYAAMMNDAQKIIKLKLVKGHSILKPDEQGLCATHYALACDREKSFKILGLGYAYGNFEEEFKQHIFKKNSSIEKLLSTVCQPTDTQQNYIISYGSEELKQAISDNNYEKTVDILFINSHLAPAYLRDKNAIIATSQINDLIIYCTQTLTESYFFDYIFNKAPHQEEWLTLLESGYANPNTCNKRGIYLLHYFCIFNEKKFHKLLIKFLALEKIDVNVRDPLETTPLHLAASDGRFDTLTALLNTKKCDLNALAQGSDTPLYYSVQGGHLECAKALIAAGADMTIIALTNKNLLHIAAMEGHVEMLKMLIKPLKQYIEHRDIIGRTPLTCCAANNPKNAAQCIQVLINAGAHKEARTNNKEVALHCAAEWNHPEVAEVLLKNKANVNILVLDDIPVNGVLYTHYTPLHLAAQRGHYKIIKILLKHGANKALKTVNGETALDLAKKYKDIELTKNDIPSITEHEAKLAHYEKIIKLLL